ncbi:DUF2283 domain-containing protein [Leptolyngbya sp. KIOST-1]|uniref:DUF2283 domain-containing protein n=1 Tax=Leptolyngbya sp. KIOST-1 TaxID=1229172 RepID=UPI0005645128|nr:DUF2283 domain-containing protein [Leptolyngbya sp. KIOST-1]
MSEKLLFQYDQVSDIFYINKCAPYAEQESEEIGDEMIARLNPVSGEVENLEILFFSKRLLNADFLLELPVIANLRLAAS